MRPEEPSRRTRKAMDSDLRWRSLKLLNLFRLSIGLAFLLGFLLQPEGGMLGSVQERLFLICVIGLVGLSAVSALTLEMRWFSAHAQGLVQLLIDSSLYLLILQSSGGLETGLGNLLFIPVVTASLILGQRTAITLAAMITLALLFQQVLITWSLPQVPARFTHAGILCALLMLASVIGAHLARRLRESEALAQKRGLDLRNLAELNDYIIQQLRTGIVVVDHQDRMQLANGAAAQFLGLGIEQRGKPVHEISKQLDHLVKARREKPFERPPSFTAADGETLIVPRFTELGDQNQPGTLIFLEDSSVQSQRAQEMKLAALGRFTASIAHELRNPLGAISHASQLLEESPRLTEEERKLTAIVDRHTRRLNNIIETVLKLSRREETRPSQLNLSRWLEHFRQELEETGRLEARQVGLVMPEEDISVLMDENHLHQVVSNLVDNALRYGDSTQAQQNGQRVQLRITRAGSGHRPCLEVIDFGPGIAEEEANHVFEPFYTASPRGTGLGLFVARELCDCNRARLEYRREEGRTVFRIIFADPGRWLS